MKYASLLLAVMWLSGCAMRPPALREGMTESEVDQAMMQAWPPGMLEAAKINEDGTIVKIYQQKSANITGDIGTTFQGGKLVKTNFWVY